MNWYQKDIKENFELLKSSTQGLSSEEVAERLLEYGPNELKEVKKKTLFMMFLDQFKDFMIMVLIAAAVVSGIIGELVDTIAIVVIVILNAIIGFVQEYRAEKAMKALKQMAAPTALVLRDNNIISVPASELVPGDIVMLEAGRIVPADIRLTESAQLKIEEAALTGESIPVEKTVETFSGESIPLGDRKNMAYKGTIVSYGRGTGIVVATGMKTELGKIATLLQDEEEVKTPLQKRLAKFGQRLGIAVLAICAIVFATGLMRGVEPLLMFLTAISLAVAAIPEALPAVVTISLALGAKKMVKQNALVRKLPAVETLGSVTYICSDKTGTLTLNKMTVEELFVEGELIADAGKLGDAGREGDGETESAAVSPYHRITASPRHYLMTAMALNNDAVPDKDNDVIGDPTEIALFEIARKNGFEKSLLEKDFPRIAEIPFDSDRKCMTTFHAVPASPSPRVISFTKGAFENIIGKSSHILSGKGVIELNETIRKELTSANEKMADDGLRTLAFAVRQWDAMPAEMTPGNVEDNLVFIGLAGLMDPPREEAKESVGTCKTAGIKPVMITGDHPLTARNIARRLGIIDDGDGVMTGQELEKLSLEEFEEKVGEIRVYARVAPEQKIKIVKALQDKGEFVAMTGDGVNDAPALKRADIGVAMGITGTDVSKESAHMILLDDNFATIVKAVREGRRIFDNIRKFIKYTMTSNSGEIWTIFIPPFLGLPIPLLPIHILWINLVTDGLPGLALAVEPAEKGIMNKPPRHPKESIFAHGLGYHLFWVGLLMGSVSVFTQAWFINSADTHWQTMVFTVLSLSQMGHVLAVRSERESLFRLGLFSNKSLLGAVLLTFFLQMATIYVPVLNPIFRTAPLTAGELFITLALSSVVFIAVEIEKWWFRRRER
ncbi:MAG TPA: cation-translocating P-type ATPase [Nitrospirae bacterium]|nr:calcium-transporting ATPase 1 [bacterium BMS3Abin06]HDH12180.1 cation-translocating P-type ATPase [Nitrospirota bacterium]HDZ03120.1 cation-translocating P-type ATPase [Nitrospirota bacterium]